MPFQKIKITGYLEDSLEPVFDETDDCYVRLSLSGRPLKAWKDLFRKRDKRLKLQKRAIRLRTNGRVVDQDIERLKHIIGTVNSEFEELHRAAFVSEREIALFLREQFPRPEAEESAGA